MIYMEIVYLFLTYLLSGVPFGLIICKVFKKIDLREYGSKNVGATNVGRVAGKKYAVITFALDGLKSFLPVLFSGCIFGEEFRVFVLFFAVIGHIFSIWLKGRGGKGISSSIVGLLALDYRLGIVMSSAWLLVFLITKISSLAALTSVVAFITTSYFISSPVCFYTLCVMAIIIFWSHRENIKRLISGAEFKFNK